MKIPKQHIKDFLVAFSFVNLCFMRVWIALIYPENYFFEQNLPVILDYGALILNIIFFSALAYFIIYKTRKITSLKIKVAFTIIFLITSLIPLNFIRLSFGFRFVSFLNSHVIFIILNIFIIILLIYLIRFHLKTFLKVIYISLLIISPYGFINIIQTTLLNQGKPQNRFIQVNNKQPIKRQRVILFIFDELDYYRLFIKSNNPQLTTIEDLKYSSLFALKAYSPSNRTILSILSYINGRTIIDAQPINESDANLKIDGIPNQIKISSFISNLFSNIYSLGYKTALIGWHIPYCRLYGEWTDSCFIESSQLSNEFLKPTLFSKVKKQIQSLNPLYGRIRNIEYFKKISQEVENALGRPNIDFIYVHWPIPHMPGLYDTKKQILSPYIYTDEYNSNLTLINKILQDTIGLMKKNNVWDDTILIITSDHGWRSRPENEKQWIRRIPFMIKLAGKNMTYKEINEPFNTLILYDLIPALLKKEISTPDEVVNFIHLNKAKFPIMDIPNMTH